MQAQVEKPASKKEKERREKRMVTETKEGLAKLAETATALLAPRSRLNHSHITSLARCIRLLFFKSSKLKGLHIWLHTEVKCIKDVKLLSLSSAIELSFFPCFAPAKNKKGNAQSAKRAH